MTPERLEELEKQANDCCWAFCPKQAKELIAAVKEAWTEIDSATHTNEDLAHSVTERDWEIQRLQNRPAPRCPECWSNYVGCLPFRDGGYFAVCDGCAFQGSVEATIDAALDAWRKEVAK